MARYFSRSQKLLILRKSNYKCVICGIELNIDNFVADHIIPYSLMWSYSKLELIMHYVHCVI